MAGVPSGLVTFLFTDIENSTRAWTDDEAAMASSLRLHDELWRTTFGAHGGHVFATGGDGFAVAFQRASDAVAAATEVQERMAEAAWPGPALRVRAGVHLGEADERDGDYFGSAVSTAARVMATANGGQTVASEAVVLAGRMDARQLGTHTLRGVADPISLFQIGPGSFGALQVPRPEHVVLPTPPTALVGRGAEVSHVGAMLAEHRCVTLTGVGGTGKTRLAIAAGEVEVSRSPDGVVFVDLTAAPDDAQVLGAVASTMGVDITGGSDPIALFAEVAARWNGLVVLDNCEHVIDGAADLVTAVLAAPGPLRILATSREALDVPGEHVVQVRSLPTDADGAAVELFIERATASGAAIDPDDPDTVAAISALCHHLDGMPLAIELAAARARAMSPEQLLERIGDRFALLSGQRRGRGRQHTLESTIDWSYQLLTDDEQRVWRRCSVFPGSFDLPAATFVDAGAGADGGGGDELATMDAIESLVAKSMITTTHGRSGLRYRLLETLRVFAQDRLVGSGEATNVRNRLPGYVIHRFGDWNGPKPWAVSRCRIDDIPTLELAVEVARGGDDDRTRHLYGALVMAHMEEGATPAHLIPLGESLALDPTTEEGGWLTYLRAQLVTRNHRVTTGRELLEQMVDHQERGLRLVVRGELTLHRAYRVPSGAFEVLGDLHVDDHMASRARSKFHNAALEIQLIAGDLAAARGSGLSALALAEDDSMAQSWSRWALAQVELRDHEPTAALDHADASGRHDSRFDPLRAVAHAQLGDDAACTTVLAASADEIRRGSNALVVSNTFAALAGSALARSEFDVARKVLMDCAALRGVLTPYARSLAGPAGCEDEITATYRASPPDLPPNPATVILDALDRYLAA